MMSVLFKMLNTPDLVHVFSKKLDIPQKESRGAEWHNDAAPSSAEM